MESKSKKPKAGTGEHDVKKNINFKIYLNGIYK